MDWIKTNYDRFLLGVSAIILLAMSALLMLQVKSFQESFAARNQVFSRNNKVEAVQAAKMSALQDAAEKLAKPAAWGLGRRSELFVSRKYIVKDGALVSPEDKNGPNIHDPVPNVWFLENKLDLLAPEVLEEDPDGDGFSNFDEWRGKTDPNVKESHPAYITKLRLARSGKRPFRIILKSWDGDAANPESLTFQINTVDIRQPTQFVKMKSQIAGTKFKPIRFEVKEIVDSNNIKKDVSELTVEGDPGEMIVLPVEKIVDSPDSFAVFKYIWNGAEFTVKKKQEFSLQPEEARKYKLIDITATEALIQSVDAGENITVPMLGSPVR